MRESDLSISALNSGGIPASRKLLNKLAQDGRRRLPERVTIQFAQPATDPLPCFHLHVAPESVIAPGVRNGDQGTFRPIVSVVTHR